MRPMAVLAVRPVVALTVSLAWLVLWAGLYVQAQDEPASVPADWVRLANIVCPVAAVAGVVMFWLMAGKDRATASGKILHWLVLIVVPLAGLALVVILVRRMLGL